MSSIHASRVALLGIEWYRCLVLQRGLVLLVIADVVAPTLPYATSNHSNLQTQFGASLRM